MMAGLEAHCSLGLLPATCNSKKYVKLMDTYNLEFSSSTLLCEINMVRSPHLGLGTVQVLEVF